MFFGYSYLTLQAQQQLQHFSVKDGLPQSDVSDVVQDKIGYLWFATQGGGIARFDGINFDVFSQKEGLLSNFTNSFLLKNDSLFIATNNGLSIKVKNQFTNYKTPKINKIVWLKNKMFLATSEGIYQFKKEYVAPLKIDLKIDLANVLDIEYQNSFYWIKTSNTIWKSTTLNTKAFLVKSNLKQFDELFNTQKSIINNLKIDISIKANANKVFVDRQLNQWILTNGYGVYKSVSSNFKHFTDTNNIDIKAITAIHKNKDKIWFTDANQNLFNIDSLGIHFIRKNYFKTNSITSDKQNNLWFGSQNKGVYIYRNQTGSLSTSDFNIERLYTKNGLPNDKIQNIIIQNDAVWVITQTAGILKLAYNFEQNFVKKISRFNRNNGIKNQQITTSLLHKNKIWYGTKSGDIGNIDNEKVTHYARILSRNTTINNLIFSDKNLYIGTLENGVWKASLSKIKNVKQIESMYLSSKISNQLYLDSKNHLWMGSEKGVDKLEILKDEVVKATHYNQNDGFTGIETSKNTILEDSFGNIWFGTKNGITKYTATNQRQKSVKPTVYFTTINVAYQSIDSIKKQFKKEVLQLSPTQNNISFDFKTVDVNQPKRIEYQWVLNENESNWSTTNSVNFANQSPGNYTFTVRSRNASKTESEPITFSFFIDKPLYQKTWFLATIIGFSAIVIFLFVFYYLKRKQEENQQKITQLKLENHLITLEQKALQLQMNPHFIFNILNGIKAYGNNGNTKELNTTISQFATLLRSLLHNSRKEEISLFEEIETLKNYLSLEQKINAKFEYSITADVQNIDLEEILIPPMLVQPFVENSIKHGFTTDGKLEIEFTSKNNFLNCIITDNGIGFEQSKKLKGTKNHTSVALKVTKERIQNLSKNSRFSIKELLENDKIIGTKVEFKIPLKTDF